jgi:HAE1 family hydrophobic/amphiphilic exporter-1
MIGGLLSSLLLTVFVVPMVYYVVDKIKDKFQRKQSDHHQVALAPVTITQETIH